MIAAVTMVRESFRLVRLSHDCCAKSGEAAIANVTAERTATNRPNIDVLLSISFETEVGELSPQHSHFLSGSQEINWD
jgi:hypothetical protein